jgi:PrtD family type I secretion system ABC transporter
VDSGRTEQAPSQPRSYTRAVTQARRGEAFLRQTLRRSRGALTAVGVFSFFINLLMLTASLYSMQLFDRVLTSRSINTLVYLTILAILCFVILWLLDLARGQVMATIAAWFDDRLGPRLFAGAVAGHAPLAAGPAASQPLRDLGTLRGFLIGPYLFPMLDAPWSPVLLIVLFLLHPLVGIVALGGAVILVALAWLSERWTKAAYERAAHLASEGVFDCDALVRNADSVRAMGLIGQIASRWKARNAMAIGYTQHATFRANFAASLSRAVRQVLQVLVLAVGAWLTLKGEMSAGALIASTILVARTLAPVEQAIAGWRQAVAAGQAYRRIGAFIEHAESYEADGLLFNVKGRIVAEDVIYLHPNNREPTLRGISFVVEPGESIAMLGPSGSGKTTLARLIAGAIKPNAGALRIDGMEVTAWKPEDRGPNVGFLPQTVELFRGTVGENIARMRKTMPKLAHEAAELARAHETIQALPSGYETRIGDGGVGLSGGQRQKIGLARAVFGKPKVVVLDEPNAHLDQPGEAALYDTLRELKARGVTVVVVTHRAGLLDHVDKIMVVRDGRIAAFGPRVEVLARIAPQPRIQAVKPGGAHA